MDRDLQYELALSILNSMVGFCFQDLDVALEKAFPDYVEVTKLKNNFAEACMRRDLLARGNEVKWQAAIDEWGPVVKLRVESLRSFEPGRL